MSLFEEKHDEEIAESTVAKQPSVRVVEDLQTFIYGNAQHDPNPMPMPLSSRFTDRTNAVWLDAYQAVGKYLISRTLADPDAKVADILEGPYIPGSASPEELSTVLSGLVLQVNGERDPFSYRLMAADSDLLMVIE